jgi:hypothetical protein
MCRFLLFGLLAVFFVVSAWADKCEAIVAEAKVPVKLKTRGKPKVGKWERIDEVLNELGQKMEAVECELTFGELFRNKKEEELYFPITNTALRVVPEESFRGVRVYRKGGELLGVYANRSLYERSGGLQLKKSYKSYYFQYEDLSKKLQSVGHRLLLDDFVVRWMDIKDKVAVSGK